MYDSDADTTESTDTNSDTNTNSSGDPIQRGEAPDRRTDHEIVTDGGFVEADGTDLTRFQLEILYQLARGPDYGLGIKRSLESYYDEEVNHGRLYPNLDDLVDDGYVERSKLDKRTNEYALTDRGKALVVNDADRRQAVADDVQVPTTDGGLNDKTAAKFVQSVLDGADPALTPDERQKLGAVIEYLRGDEQTDANGGEN